MKALSHIGGLTATVATGSKAVSVVGDISSWLAPGYRFGSADGLSWQIIDTPGTYENGATTFSLAENWGGATLAADAAQIEVINEGQSLGAKFVQIINLLVNGILEAIASIPVVNDNIIQWKDGVPVGRSPALLLEDLSDAGAVTKTGAETLSRKTLVKPTISGILPMVSRGLVIGDSTIASQNGNPSIASLILSSADALMGVTVNSIAYPGHTINQQLAAYTALSDKAAYDWVFVQVGLNDVDPSVATATTISQYQALIDAIRSGSPNATLIVSAMNPSKSRMVESLPTTWAAAYQKWLDLNTAIMGGGTSPVTGVHYRQDKHVRALNDGADSLAYVYQDLTDPVSPKIHENAIARALIATAWREVLVQAGFLSVSTPAAYSPYFAEIGGVIKNLRASGFATGGTLSVYNNTDPTKSATLAVSALGNAAFDTSGKTATFGSGSGSLALRWDGRYTGFLGILDANNSKVYGIRATSVSTTDPVSGYEVVGLFGFYDGMGVSGTSNYAADNNPVFGVNAKDQLAGTTYGIGHNLFNVQNNGYVSTYRNVLDDGSGRVLIGYGSSNGSYLLQVNSQIFSTSSAIATSDQKYKKDVDDIDDPLSLVCALRPRVFTWKSGADAGEVLDASGVVVRDAHNFPKGRQIGFIAQEIEEALADCEFLGSIVKTNARDEIVVQPGGSGLYDEQGNEIPRSDAGRVLAPKDEFKGIAESNLVALLVGAVKQLEERNSALSDRLDAFEAANTLP